MDGLRVQMKMSSSMTSASYSRQLFSDRPLSPIRTYIFLLSKTIKLFLMRITLLKLLMTLPGTPFIYYGQELGMSDLDLEEHPKECQLDVQAESRDGCRSPFRWTNSSEENYGFSSCINDETADNVCERSCTWLPTGYKNPVNVDDQPGFSN